MLSQKSPLRQRLHQIYSLIPIDILKVFTEEVVYIQFASFYTFFFFLKSQWSDLWRDKIRSKMPSVKKNILFFHTQQHNIQNTTKQNNRHILNISRFNQKGGGEGRTTRTQKLLLYIITYIQQKTLPSINGRRPGPTDSRRCTFT